MCFNMLISILQYQVEMSLPSQKSKYTCSEGEIYPAFNKLKGKPNASSGKQRGLTSLAILADEGEREKADEVIKKMSKCCNI